MREAVGRDPFVRALLAAVVVGVLSVACCPVPAGSAEAPTAFSATVAAVDARGYWAEAGDGSRWRVAGVPPAGTGERIYLEGVWTSAGAFLVERATALPDL